ncbi:MAG: cytochrome c maturation protein CcmE [Hyphomicrobiales bacterium]
MQKTRKKIRLVLIGVVGAVLSVAVGLVLFGLSDQITLFKTPTDIATEGLDPGTRVRVGGLVKEETWEKEGTSHTFTVTDGGNDLSITYVGILPDLFREGQGVVLEGSRNNSGVFVADNVLAKHDENYVPKEVADALKAQGVWKPGEALPSTN